MFCMLEKKEIYATYVSKHNTNREKQVIILMISNGDEWHYITVIKLPTFLRGIISFYCPNCLHSFRAENKRELHMKVFENRDFCNVVMPSEDT